MTHEVIARTRRTLKTGIAQHRSVVDTRRMSAGWDPLQGDVDTARHIFRYDVGDQQTRPLNRTGGDADEENPRMGVPAGATAAAAAVIILALVFMSCSLSLSTIGGLNH